MNLLKRIALWMLGGLALAMCAIQLVPVARTNPPVESGIDAPPQVQSILRRACYDCHSNETTWPWYSRIAPISWMVARDVREARREMNFSTWNRLDRKKRIRMIHEVWEQVEDGEMPPWFYLPAHPKARLSDADRAILQAWPASAGREDRAHH